MGTVLVVWIILAIIGLKKNNEDSQLAMLDLLPLRGLCAFEIMIGHIGLATGSAILYPNRKAGILIVGVFFFLSGYGLAYSFCTKESYLEKFVQKKFFKLILPVCIVYLMYSMVLCIEEKSLYKLIDLLNPVQIFQQTNWYIWELLFLYLLFYLLYKYYAGENKEIIINAMLILFVAVCYIANIEATWYGSTLCFGVGVLFYKHEIDIRKIIADKKSFWFINGIALIVGMVVFYAKGDSFLGLVVGRNVSSVTFTMLVVALLYIFKVGNCVSKWLGAFSYEIFLIHPYVINILKDKIENPFFYEWLVVLITLCLAPLIKMTGKKVVERAKSIS